MTVKELIEKLQAFPKDAEIAVETEVGDRARIKIITSPRQFVSFETEGADSN